MRPPNTKESDLFTTFIFNHFQLLVVVLFGYLSIVVLASLFPRLIRQHYNRFSSLKFALFKLPFMVTSRLPWFSAKFALILLFFYCFLFFNINFLLSSIQTDHTVVDTSEIVDSTYKLTNTEKTLIILLDDQKTLTHSPKKSLLRKLSEKGRFVIGSVVTEREIEIIGRSLEDFFFFQRVSHLLFIMNVVAPLASATDLVAFVSFQNYFESGTAFYMRSKLDVRRKQFVHRW